MLTATKESRRAISSLVRSASGDIRLVERALREAPVNPKTGTGIDMDKAKQVLEALLEKSAGNQ